MGWRIWITWWYRNRILFSIRYSRLIWINFKKKHETVTDNLLITIYINKTENRITFKTKTGYYLEFLTSETKKVLESTKIKITKDENGGNVHHLEIAEVVLMHCNNVNNDYKKDSRVLHIFLLYPNKSFGLLLNMSPKSSVFLKTLDF